jgi:phosphohistidine phosphatase
LYKLHVYNSTLKEGGMKIYLVRHGESDLGEIDDERPLSEKGIADIEHLAKFIAPLDLQLVNLFHSEKLRAKQTAKILSEVVSLSNPSLSSPELDPLAPLTPMMNEINFRQGDIMLVGHMPFMGKMLAKLLTGNVNKEHVAFVPGCMVCLVEVEKNHWVIQWMLTPELISP